MLPPPARSPEVIALQKIFPVDDNFLRVIVYKLFQKCAATKSFLRPRRLLVKKTHLYSFVSRFNGFAFYELQAVSLLVARTMVGGHAGPVGIAHQALVAEAASFAAQTASSRLSQVVTSHRTLGAALHIVLASLTLFHVFFFQFCKQIILSQNHKITWEKQNWQLWGNGTSKECSSGLTN